MSAGAVVVHWMRHGRVDSHRGDIPVTPDGLVQAEAAGRRLALDVLHGETVYFLHAPTRRTRETAEALRRGLTAALDETGPNGVRCHLPEACFALRNPDLYVAGLRVEMVSTAEAMAEQTAMAGLSPDMLAGLPFLRGFWAAPDRIGYWADHPDPPGEDAATVARRMLVFATSLLDIAAELPRRYVCVTHSGLLRAFVMSYLLEADPGEPDWVESVDLACPDAGVARVRFRDQSRQWSISRS